MWLRWLVVFTIEFVFFVFICYNAFALIAYCCILTLIQGSWSLFLDIRFWLQALKWKKVPKLKNWLKLQLQLQLQLRNWLSNPGELIPFHFLLFNFKLFNWTADLLKKIRLTLQVFRVLKLVPFYKWSKNRTFWFQF